MLFDYQTLQIIWWVLIGLVLILYAASAGYDFGITMMMPFLKRKAKFADNDLERRVLLNVIAPTWDANQTWLVFAGGALFVIWPVVYATTFSGLYALMLFILWSFFLRPPGFDYRNKLPSEGWRTMWDWALFISAFFPVLMFGLAVGNLFVGLPIHFDPIMLRPFYDGNFIGLFNMMGVIAALASLFMCLMHGTAYLNRRTEGDLRAYFQRLHTWFSLVFLILLSIGAVLLLFKVQGYQLANSPKDATLHPLNNVVVLQVGGWFFSFMEHPWKWIPLVLAYAGVLLAMVTARSGRGALAFWGSCLGVAGTVALFGTALFPFLIPSTIAPEQSVTVWNGTSSQYTLMGMFYIVVVMVSGILIYRFASFWALWRKQSTITTQDVVDNHHTFY